MKYLLNSAKICGIKNIDKEVTFTFTNKTLNDRSFEESYVKTIYGCNGAGKSGLVHAFEIAKVIATRNFPFVNPLFVPKLIELINKKTRKFSIELVFNCGEKKYRYTLSVSLSDIDEPYISFESLEELTSRGGFKTCIFKIVDGTVSSDSDPFYLNANIIPTHARANSVLLLPFEEEGHGHVPETSWDALVFFFSLNVIFGGESDKHTSFDVKSYRHILDDIKNGKSHSLSKTPSIAAIAAETNGDKYLWILYPELEKHYRGLAKKLCSFVQLAKPSLKDIEVNFKHDGKLSYAELRFNYGDYSIDYEFESTGVKKLCTLFTTLVNASSGSIAIIDEADAGIHDLFLVNLIEYFALYCPCQIIMTTHNIDLMDSVKGLSKSIDILTDEPSVVPWVKKGTLSPISQYKRGYLGGTPNNLNPIDFAPIFNGKE